MLFIALYSVWNEVKCPFSLAFPLWCGLECKLDWSIHTNCPYAVRVVQLYGSATWQCEIIFTHWQLWLSGLQSAKKRFTQMAREKEHGGWMVEVDFTVSYRPLHTCVLNISSVGWCVLADMFVGLHECERIWWVYSVCVSVSDSGSLRKLHGHCEDSAGSSVPFVFARSSFPPTVGRQAQLAASLAFTGWLG